MICVGYGIQEVFHVYFNKFENFVTHLFLVILGNNWFPWVSLVSKVIKKIGLNFYFLV